ncbi:MAG TPA: DEAD/DEAH box helicase family protein [Acholeplasmataceae bacterium]|nr:DEAD/DEAH box helicase family protein [Acholeplasmataceae bacterium]
MNCDLTKYDFKSIYSNQKDVEDFYSSALLNASIYKRVTAYFTLGIFSYLKKGIVDFLKNDGYMQLIISTDIHPNIIKLINKSYIQKEEKRNILLSKSEIIKQINEIVCQEDADIFAFLIAIGKLDVKLVYKLGGIVHDKFGIISDGRHNLVYIGSNNFTEAATKNNDEVFQVTIDWDNPSKRELNTIREINLLFDELWNNEKNDVITIELPDHAISEMIDNIDYENIKKITSITQFVRLDLNDNDDILITSNFDLEPYLNYKNIGEFYSKNFLKREEKRYRLINIERVIEKKDFYEKLHNALSKDGLKLYLTKKANDYFQLHYRNYELLAKKGNQIKSDNFLSTIEFTQYKESINKCLKRDLVDKQVQSAIHIIEMSRSLNFSVPGSGKTATVLGAFEYLSSINISSPNYINKLLVIGPINCSKSWRDEYSIVSKFAKDRRPLCLINDDHIEEKKEVLLHDFKTSRVIIINYELLPKLKDVLRYLLNDRVMVVFDEIHRIKKIDGPKYLALREIIKNTRYRVALTGTPLPNGYIDLYNMISLLHDDFTQAYFQMFESNLRSDDSKYRKTGLQNRELNNLLYPFYMRINKKDLKVPHAEPDHLVDIQANECERELYRRIVNASYSSFESTIKLVEIGCVPFKCSQSIDMVDKLTMSESKPHMTSKLAKLLSIIKRNNNKCVIWCTFVDTIKMVTDLLNENGFYTKSIYGETKQEDRDKIIDEFNYGDLMIIVTNPATLAESVSLHKACHEAHYLELNYNLYQYLQSRDRIHRLGLKDNDRTNYYIYINYYDDNNKVSKDLDIYNSLKKKEELMKKSIDKGNFVFGDTVDFE